MFAFEKIHPLPIINLKHPLPLSNDSFPILDHSSEFIKRHSVVHGCDHSFPRFILKCFVADLFVTLCNAADWHQKRRINLVSLDSGEGFVLLRRDDCLLSSRIHGTQRSIVSSEIVEEGRHVTEGDLLDLPRRRNNQV